MNGNLVTVDQVRVNVVGVGVIRAREDQFVY